MNSRLLALLVAAALVIGYASLKNRDSASSVANPIKRTAPVPSVVKTPPSSPVFDFRCEHYAASISSAGLLSYRPLRSPQSKSAPELQLQLRRVTQGASVIFDRETDANPHADSNQGAVCFRHALFNESYTPRADGIEQTFCFDRPQTVVADLTFELGLSVSDLAAQLAQLQRAGGICFENELGCTAVRYGQITVHDSAQHGINIEPKLADTQQRIHFSIPEAWLKSATFPIVVDPLIGTDFMVSQNSGAGASVGGPTIVAGNGNYLVAWDDFSNSPSNPTLLASIVTQSAVVTPPFALSAVSGSPRPYLNQRIEAAFDGANWLVVWAQHDTTSAAIHGAIVTSAGTVLNGSDFIIAPTLATVEEQPLVAYNGTSFLVAWMDGTGTTLNVDGVTTSGTQINYTKVSSSAAVSPVSTLSALTNPSALSLLLLTPQKPAGDTLLVYRENTEAPAATRGTRIASDGTQRDPGGTILFQESQATGGFGQPIGATFVNSQWQILSSYDQTKDSSVFMHTLSTTGVVTPPGGRFAVVGSNSTSSTPKYAPAFAGASGWLFLRNEVSNSVYHIIGKRVGFDGTDQDPVPFQVDTATQGILRNPVAAQSGNFFLAAWLDGRSAATPLGDARNIFAAFVDSTIADPVAPALIPAISACPTSGPSPLSVAFDSAGFSGTFDTLVWDFGDGTATSTSPIVTHIYTKSGTFTASLALSHAGYTVFKSVIITVGDTSGTGASPVLVGVPVQDSGEISAGLLLNTLNVNLNFMSSQSDSIVLTASVDGDTFPKPITGTVGSLTIGSASFRFILDSRGQFTSSNALNSFVQCSANPGKGVFSFQVTRENFFTNFANVGATNSTIDTAVIVPVPITLTLAKSSAMATVGMSYTATVNQSGTGVYNFATRTGTPISGSFLIAAFAAAEQSSKTGTLAHTYTLRGQIAAPGGASFQPLPTGQFTFSIGGYSTSIPTTQLVNDGKGNFKFAGKLSTSGAGLKSFTLASQSGIFTLQLTNIPAVGAGSSGLPASSGNNISNVDLNLSFQFDLANQPFAVGRYIPIKRKNAASKAWMLQ